MRWLPGLLATVGVGLLLLVPITFTEANGEGRCDSLISGPSADDVKQADPYSLGQSALSGQRGNATCEDARPIRWAYASIAAIVTALTWAALRWPLTRSVRGCAWVGVGLVTVAACVDGPVVPLGLVAIGGALALLRRVPAE